MDFFKQNAELTIPDQSPLVAENSFINKPADTTKPAVTTPEEGNNAWIWIVVVAAVVVIAVVVVVILKKKK